MAGWSSFGCWAPLQVLLPILPRSFQRPTASTGGSVTEKINEIGVRFWTDRQWQLIAPEAADCPAQEYIGAPACAARLLAFTGER